MPYTCVAVDDEPWALRLTGEFIQKIPDLKLCGSFEDAIACGEFLRKQQIDILFVDINMPDISGIALVASLKIRPKIIFTTAYKNFAYEGFELEAVDYLLKPFGFDRFHKSVQKAISRIREEKNIVDACSGDGLFVWSEYRQVKILFSKIHYIEARDDYAYFALQDSPPVLTLMTMKDLSEKLPPEQFMRVHRGYIIPIKSIKVFSSKKILLSSGKEIPVGSSYRESIKKTLIS